MVKIWKIFFYSSIKRISCFVAFITIIYPKMEMQNDVPLSHLLK